MLATVPSLALSRPLLATRAARPQGAPAAAPQGDAPRPDFNKTEMAARFTNNLIVHIGLNDTPALLSLANVATLPPILAQGLGVLNTLNFATGCLGLLFSIRELRGTLKNPLATRTDKAVDIAHLALSDVIATAGSLLPLVPGFVGHPAGAALFVGTQLAGVAADIVKTVYDAKRGGQQSAWREARTALDQQAA